MVERDNPNVSEVYELDFYNYDEVVRLRDIDFHIAFSVESYFDRSMKDNPKYVKYLVRTYGRKNGVEFEHILPTHKCEEADWALFPPADKGSFDAIEEIKKDESRGMYCLEPSADIEIYGHEKNENYQRLEIVMLPCNYVHTHLGYEGDSVHPECDADLEEQIKYLGPLDVMLYYTEDKLEARGFGDDSIKRRGILRG